MSDTESNQALYFIADSVQKSALSEDRDPQIVEIVGDGLRSLFVIWNRGYKTICVVAEDTHEALHIAVACKHMKRAAQYRRFEDVTDKAIAGEEIDAMGTIVDVGSLLNLGRSGVLSRADDGGLSIGGCSITEIDTGN